MLPRGFDCQRQTQRIHKAQPGRTLTDDLNENKEKWTSPLLQKTTNEVPGNFHGYIEDFLAKMMNNLMIRNTFGSRPFM